MIVPVRGVVRCKGYRRDGPLPTAAYALIEKIGARFNELLAQGLPQDFFEDSPSGR